MPLLLITICSNLFADPVGFLVPHSQASTVFFETPTKSANANCVSCSSFLIFLISLLVYSGIGFIYIFVERATDLLPLSYSMASSNPSFITSKYLLIHISFLNHIIIISPNPLIAFSHYQKDFPSRFLYIHLLDIFSHRLQNQYK